jgi:hypothetical protein
MQSQGIIRKAKKGEINFLWQEFTHVLVDLKDGRGWAMAKTTFEQMGFNEGDIVSYEGEQTANGGTGIIITSVDVRVNLN